MKTSTEATQERRQAAQWKRDEEKARKRYQSAEAARLEAKRRQLDAYLALSKADCEASAALAAWIELHQPSVAAILRGETKQQEPKQPTKNNRRTQDHG